MIKPTFILNVEKLLPKSREHANEDHEKYNNLNDKGMVSEVRDTGLNFSTTI